jgi:hypothetical protein
VAKLNKNDQMVQDRLTYMDNSIDNIEGLEDVQKKVFTALKIMLLKDLDLDSDGNIKRSRKNQKAMQKMSKIRTIVLSPAYQSLVGKFIGSFNIVRSMADKQITDL